MYTSQEGIIRLQICCPKVTLPDTLLTLHRQPNSIHIGVKKLCDKFEECFFSPDTRSYASQIVDNCFLCQSNLPISRRVRGNYLSGLKLTLQGPGILWFTDVLQISNTPNAKYHSVLTFADGFTNFLIAVPFTGNMTNEIFMEIFQERVLTYYPNTKFLVSDNAKNISGNLIKQSLNLLNIFSVNTLPYSSKSNLVETFHRYLLYAIKVNIQQACLHPKDWYKILPFSIISLNNTSYYRIKYNLTPQTLQTGIRANFNSTFGIGDPNLLEEQGYEPYAIQLSKSQYVNNYLLTQLRLEKMKDNEKTQSPKDNVIKPGDLVMKLSRQINYSGMNVKLRPRLTNLFLVLITTQTSAYIRQYNSNTKLEDIKTFQEFIQSPRNKKKILNSFAVQKCDLTELKRIKSLILTTRDSKVFHQNFKVELPEPPVFEIEPGQNFAIGDPIGGQINTFGSKPVIEETWEEKEPFYLAENEEEPEIEGFIDSPGIRQISKKVGFSQHITVRNSENKDSKERIANLDKGTAYTPTLLPICRISKL
jgi:hypothetical protein